MGRRYDHKEGAPNAAHRLGGAELKDGCYYSHYRMFTVLRARTDYKNGYAWKVASYL